MANQMEMEMEMAKPQLGSAQKDPSDPPSSPHSHAETSVGPPLSAPSDRPKPPREDQPAKSNSKPRSGNELDPQSETSVEPPPLTAPLDCPVPPQEDEATETEPKGGNKLDPHSGTSVDLLPPTLPSDRLKPPLEDEPTEAEAKPKSRNKLDVHTETSVDHPLPIMPSDRPKRPREDEPADVESKSGNKEEIEREESGTALKKKTRLDMLPENAENAVAKDEMLLNPEIKSSFDEESEEGHEETSEDVIVDPSKKSEKKKKPHVEVKLGPKTFENSMEMYDFFADFVHGWSLNIDANKYEHLVLMDLLKKGCPDPSAKIGAGVKAFQVRIHPEFDNRCFYIIRKDGSMEDFSFRKCVDNLMGLPPRQRSGGNKRHSKNNSYGGRWGHHENKPNKFGGRGGHHGRNFGGRGSCGRGGHGGHRW